MTTPKQKRGQSKQDYTTPADFLCAVRSRFGTLAWDLAASAENAKAPNWIGRDDVYNHGDHNLLRGTLTPNSLTVDWFRLSGLLWLNPPFANIQPWAAKCAEESEAGAKILLLTPASVGSDWYKDHVHDKAYVLALNGRLTFGGTKPNPRTGKVDQYPKDCMLSIFGLGYTGFNVWDWRKTVALAQAA